MVARQRHQNPVVYRERSVSTLLRAITLSQGSFSLIFAHCNSSSLRQQVLQQLHQISPVPLQEITLEKSAQTLYTTILAELGHERPQVLMVLGLYSLLELDRVLISTNIVRDEFRKTFACPLVLWVTDEVIRKMIRLAPDFESWGGNAIRFIPTLSEQANSPIQVNPLQEVKWPVGLLP